MATDARRGARPTPPPSPPLSTPSPSPPPGHTPGHATGGAPADAPTPPPAHDHHPRRLPRLPPRKPIVPFVPTAEFLVDAMLDLAAVGPGDVLYDLGCGDGRIVIAAARRGACGVGVDIDRLRVREGHWNAERAGLTDRVTFVRASLYDVDVRPATVVALYLLPSVNRKLRPRLLRELRTGSRIVSNFFDMADWPPDARSEARGRELYLWLVPAFVEGRWKCVMNFPTGRRHLTLRLTRKYQKVTGTVHFDRQQLPVESGRLAGDRLTFSFLDRPTHTRHHCTAAATATTLRGTCNLTHPDTATAIPPFEWGGTRDR